MTVSRILWNYLWIAPALLQTTILWVMVRRGLHKTFPLFFAYTAYSVGEFLILFPMYHLINLVPGWLYGHTRLCLVAGGAALGFGITYEIFVYVSHSYKWLNRRGKSFVRGTILVLFVLAILLAKHTHPSHIDHPTMFSATLLDRSVVLLQCGLLVGLLSLSRLLHLEWRRPAFGIALGIAIYASAELVLLSVNAHIGYFYPLDYAYMGSYHICVLIWLYYLVTPEKAAHHSDGAVPAHNELDAWSREIERLLQNR